MKQHRCKNRRTGKRKVSAVARPHIRGKFISSVTKILYQRGYLRRICSWRNGIEFHDFAAMAAQDINTVRIPHTLLPTSLLDKAYRHGLRVIGGLSAEQLSDISRDREKGVFRDSAVVRLLSKK
jgi:hypothetical protein